MALETLADTNQLSRDQVRAAFRMTHNGFLTLQNELAKAGPCAAPLIPSWRALRDAWGRFYYLGWSARRYDEMMRFRMQLFRMRSQFIHTCARAEASVPLYASL